mmetsp:Transcript_65785/g.132102  ORF Transcript_65785/g.132102 Transcript_65785/m.132102 type:complete len:101 (-) Transcript_65785:100-402(-)
MMQCVGKAQQNQAMQIKVDVLRGDIEKNYCRDTPVKNFTVEAFRLDGSSADGTNTYVKVNIGDGQFIRLHLFDPWDAPPDGIQVKNVLTGPEAAGEPLKF